MARVLFLNLFLGTSRLVSVSYRPRISAMENELFPIHITSCYGGLIFNIKREGLFANKCIEV